MCKELVAVHVASNDVESTVSVCWWFDESCGERQGDVIVGMNANVCWFEELNDVMIEIRKEVARASVSQASKHTRFHDGFDDDEYKCDPER